MSYLFDNTVRFDGSTLDAFGRLRTSSPFTLFDSYHRYGDNGKISTAQSATGAVQSHNAVEGLVECTLSTESGAYIHRESSRVFAYQPGKSLLVLQTFVLAAPKANLRQRFGYFGTATGLFFETLNTELAFVRRNNGVDVRVPQSSWNGDKLDGTGPSGLTLDPTRSQILFTDIEWLGVGSVRMGFVINGQFIIAHTFHHANIISSTYMTTACLPVRAEIQNIGATASASTLKIICTSVLSEGGYEPRGRSRSFGYEPATTRTLSVGGTYYPVASIRLRADRLDGIVLPSNFNLIGLGASTYRWKLLSGAAITGGTWVTPTDGLVEYNLTGTAISGGTELRSGIFTSTNSSSPLVSLDGQTFKYQLERNSFTSTALTFTLAVAGASNNDSVQAVLDYEEVT